MTRLSRVAVTLLLLVPASLGAASGTEASAGSIAILRDALPGHNLKKVDALIVQLRKEGFDVTPLTVAAVCQPRTLTADRHRLYIIPHCSSYPAAGFEVLAIYIKRGGHVLFLGGPLLDRPVWQLAGKWLTRDDLARIRQSVLPTHRLFEDDSKDATKWVRTSNNPSSSGDWKLVVDHAGGGTCFQFSASSLTGWDGYLSPSISELFAEGNDLLTFRGKGSPATSQVAVEIQETDGSRWIAVAALGIEWRRVSLGLDDFSYWPDSPTGGRRGAGSDQLQPRQACRIGFQLSQSHTTKVARGKHEFWIADVGTCRNPVAEMESKGPHTSESFETIYPRYKVYSLEEEMAVGVSPRQRLLRMHWEGAVDHLVCAIPRTTGAGFQRGQRWRYIPLVDALDSDDRHRGSPVWILVNRTQPSTDSVLAAVGINDERFYDEPAFHELVIRLSKTILSQPLLAEAGTEHFSYWPSEPIHIGAVVTNVSGQSGPGRLIVTIRDSQEELVQTLALRPGSTVDQGTKRWRASSPVTLEQPGQYQVVVELRWKEQVVDQIQHFLTVLDPRPATPDEFIVTRGNDFYLAGEEWYPVGINYWPQYVSGMDRDDYWAGWLQRRYYDARWVEEDLQRMKDLGINLVSIQANDPKFYRNLLDFLARCRRHGIYVNLFCGLASPLDFREQALREFIETAHLADNATIFAYDTIWEPGNYVFSQSWRRRWDPAWRDWLIEQYGSVEEAEQDWQFACPRDRGGLPTSPEERQFREDGRWRVFVAAYRRFMDDFMSRKWNQASRKLREIDANHLISFRQGNTLPHDFTLTATARHIDFICPEGYAIPHSEDGYHAAGFITRFVHFTTHGKPIIWSEFGQSVWDADQMEPASARFASVADYHELFYRMVLESGANGTAPWWWPGGYRVGERSDYGVMNPDGTPRPSAKLIRKYAPQLKAARDWPESTEWFDFDRDRHAGGYWYAAFNTGKDAYRRVTARGQMLGIRTAGTNTTSRDVPLIAVGNRPCHGANPPKFLNAEFNFLEILNDAGHWVEAADGAEIRVASGPVKARISVGNTQESTWIAPENGQPKTGDVLLVTTKQSGLVGEWPLRDSTAYLADADFGEITLCDSIVHATAVELRMSAIERTEFGEKRSFTLTPK
jgi:hypothetical protein